MPLTAIRTHLPTTGERQRSMHDMQKKRLTNPYVRAVLSAVVTACLLALVTLALSGNWARLWDDTSYPSTSKMVIFWRNVFAHGLWMGIQNSVLFIAGCIIIKVRGKHSIVTGIISGSIMAGINTGLVLAAQFGGSNADRLVTHIHLAVIFVLPLLLAALQLCSWRKEAMAPNWSRD